MVSPVVYQGKYNETRREIVSQERKIQDAYQTQLAERLDKETGKAHEEFLRLHRISGGIDFLGGVFA